MGDTYGGALYAGTKGKIVCGSHGANGARIIPPQKMKAYKQPPATLPRSIGHRQEWLAASCVGARSASDLKCGRCFVPL